MCRLFLSIGIDKTQIKPLIEDFLYKSTIQDKMDNGYGFAWRNINDKWKIYKSHKPYYQDKKVKKIIEHVSQYNTIIGHVRIDNSKLTKIIAKPALENTHPFFYKNKIFEHNGFIRNLAQHKNFLISQISSKYVFLLRGNTDTEILFYLFLSFLEIDPTDPKTAMKNIFAFFHKNKISGQFNIIYGDNNLIMITRYSLDEITIPLYVYNNNNYKNCIISSTKIIPEQKMIKKNEIIIIYL